MALHLQDKALDQNDRVYEVDDVAFLPPRTTDDELLFNMGGILDTF